MAASDSSPRSTADEDEHSESGVGISHLTVVPANFEAVEGDGSED